MRIREPFTSSLQQPQLSAPCASHSRFTGRRIRMPVASASAMRRTAQRATRHPLCRWDEGIQGMRVGGQRKLLIPSDLAYGVNGAGSSIPPDSDLVFETEVVGIASGLEAVGAKVPGAALAASTLHLPSTGLHPSPMRRVWRGDSSTHCGWAGCCDGTARKHHHPCCAHRRPAEPRSPLAARALVCTLLPPNGDSRDHPWLHVVLGSVGVASIAPCSVRDDAAMWR